MDNIYTKIVFGVLSLFAMASPLDVKGDDAAEETAKRTIAYVNYINGVIETIRAYNNVLVLEEEYKALSDNLNLDSLVLADPEVKDVIMEIMDALYDFQKKERDWDRFKREVSMERARARAKRNQEFIRALTENAVKKVADGGVAAVLAATTPLGAAVVIGKQLLSIFKDSADDGMNAYFKYQDAVNEIADKVEQEKYRISEDNRMALHKLNKKMLDRQASWLSRYKGSAWCNDSARVTPAEIGELIEVLKYSATDPSKVLEPMKKKFPVFPVYWYNLAMSAAKAERYELALEACNRFEAVSCGILRKDKMACGVAMSKITALVGLGKIDKAEIARCLEIITHNNWASDNVDASCFCAMVYASIMKDRASATKVLGACSVLLQGKADSQLREYCDLFKRGVLNPAREKDVPVFYDLARCRILQAEIDNSLNFKLPLDRLAEICARETTGSLEKLYYVGKLRVKDLWKYARSEIEGIEVAYQHVDAGGRFVVLLPVPWLVLGELRVEVELLSGTKTLGTLSESIPDRKLWLGGNGARVSYLCFPDTITKRLCMVNAIRLKIEHPSWPTSIEFIPCGENYNVMTGLPDNARLRFSAYRVCSFMDSEFDEALLDEAQIIDSLLPSCDLGPNRTSKAQAKGSDNAFLAEFRIKDSLSIERCGIESIDGQSCMSNGYIGVEYSNRSGSRQVVEIGVACRNIAGAVLCAGVDRISINPGSSGKIWLKRPSMPYDYMRGINPAYGTVWISSGSTTWTECGAQFKSMAYSYSAMKARLLLDAIQDETIYGVEISDAEFKEKRDRGVWGKMKGIANGMISIGAKHKEKAISAVKALGVNEPVDNLIGVAELKVFTAKEFNEDGIVFTTDSCYWGHGRGACVAWQSLNDVGYRGRQIYVNGRKAFELTEDATSAENVVYCMNQLKDVFALKEVNADTDTFADVEKSIAAANRGEAEGLFSLGLYAYNSPLMEKDCDLAYRCWVKAAGMGNPAAQGSLAAMYFKGDGVAKDFIEGARWLERAAENGDVFSQFKLGELYETGVGVRKDRALAIKWYSNAARAGSDDAKKRLRQLGASL